MLIVIICLFCAAIAFLLVQLIAKPVGDLYNEPDTVDQWETTTDKIAVEETLVEQYKEEPPKKKRGRKPKVV